MKKQTEEELEVETTTSGGMGSFPNNANGWADKKDLEFPYEDQPETNDSVLDEEDSSETDSLIFEAVEFHLLSKNAKKFLLSVDSTSTRSMFQAAAAMQVPLSNLLSTFYSTSSSVLRIAEEVMSAGEIVKIINNGPEWWFIITTYRGIDFVIFSCVYGNPLPDPNVPMALAIAIKYSDFEMMTLAFPDLEFILAQK